MNTTFHIDPYHIRDYYLLDPDIVFLNHGSFGACPRPVFEVYQAYQRELERQPVEFLARRFDNLLQQSRDLLGEFLHTNGDNLAYFPNPTTAINMVARSLKLSPGDEVITTNHEYGAMDRTWRFVCRQSGARYVQVPIELPFTPTQAAEEILAALTPRTKVLFLSHITSATAVRLPIEQLCAQAKRLGILTVIDGAHAPGQIPLDLDAMQADIYAGACHKWLSAPKGVAFLFARPEIQPLLEPLIISWGYESETPSSSQFVDYHQWQGTKDYSACLTVPSAIAFQQELERLGLKQQARHLAKQARLHLESVIGCGSNYPGLPDDFAQMFTLPLPPSTNLDALKLRLYEHDHIEVPLIDWNGKKFLRLSLQVYNTPNDIDRLATALSELRATLLL